MPSTPSFMSRASAKRFFTFKKKDKRPDTRNEEVPPAKKRTDKSPEQQKDEIADDHAKQVEKEKKEEDDSQELREKPTQTVRAPKPQAPLPTSKAAAQKELADLDEELEQETEAKGNYAVVFDHQNNEQFRTIKYGERSYYTPNYIGIEQPLYDSHLILNANLKFQDKNVSYFTGDVDLYYSVLYYIRILQVRNVLGENTYTEDRFFRAFQRQFKLVSLPVVGFLEPAFSNIAFYEPRDKRLSYLVPQIGAMMTPINPIPNALQTYTYTINARNALIQPDVSILYERSHMMHDPTFRFQEAHRIHNESFVPRAQDAAANFYLGGHEFEGQAANHVDQTGMMRLNGPHMSRPLTESIERLVMIRGSLTKSGFVQSGPARHPQARASPTSIGGFLSMEDSNWHWFTPCIDAALTHAKMFNGMTNLGSIPTRGSMEVAAKTTLHVNATQHLTAAPVHIPLTNGNVPWHANPIRTVYGNSVWYEPGIEDYTLWMTRQMPVNSVVHIHMDTRENVTGDQEIVALENEFGHAQDNAAIAARYGPYWAVNRNYSTTGYDHRILGARYDTPNMLYFDRMRSYTRQFYVEDGKSYKW